MSGYNKIDFGNGDDMGRCQSVTGERPRPVEMLTLELFEKV